MAQVTRGHRDCKRMEVGQLSAYREDEWPLLADVDEEV